MKFKRTLISASVLLAFASAAVSQEEPAAAAPDKAGAPKAGDSTQDIGVVVITARRRLERAQDVPIAVTVFGQEDIRARNVETATDLQNFVPSLNVLGIATGPESFTIRGMGATGATTGGGVGGGQGVVAYFAEAPSTASGPGLFFDLQNLQVLKGPQGTLFGRNTTGGAVLLEPQRPSFDDTDGYVELAAGDYGRKELRFAGNISLVPEKFALRIAGQSQSRGGYVRDAVTGQDYSDRNSQAVRIGLLATPSSSFENYLVAQAVQNKDHGTGNVLVAVNPASPLAPMLQPYLLQQQARGNRQTSYGFTPESRSESITVVDNARLQVSKQIAFKNIFSYSHTRANASFDGDATPLPIADFHGADPGGWASDLRTYTEELQLQGKFLDDQLSLQSGLYYEDVRNAGPQTYNIEFNPVLLHQSAKDESSRSRAAYAQATLDLGAVSAGLKGLNVTAGFRETWDHFFQGAYLSGAIPALGAQQCLTGAGPYPDCMQTGSSDSHGPSWTTSVDYHISPATLVYAQVSQGYKSGGFNGGVPQSDPRFTFAPEKVRSYEAGVKSVFKWGSMPGQWTFDVFDTAYRDVQRNVYATVIVNGLPATLQVTSNAASATIRGAEMEGAISPFKAARFSLTYSYLDAHYDHYVTPIGQDFTSHPFEYTPRHKISLDQLYHLPSGGRGDLTFRATVSYQSSISVADDPQPYDTIPGYSLVNLRLDWKGFYRNSWSEWDASLFGTNVGNREYRVYTNPTYVSSGLVTTAYGEPRMWGVSLRARF